MTREAILSGASLVLILFLGTIVNVTIGPEATLDTTPAQVLGWSGGPRIATELQESSMEHPLSLAGFELLKTFLKPNPSGDEMFGWSVASSNGGILVGSPYDDAGARNAGAAYLFDLPTGTLDRALQSPAASTGSLFARTVLVLESYLLVGAPYDDSAAPNAGAVYVFDAGAGSLLRSLLNPTPSSGDLFGQSVTSFSGHVVVGAPYDDIDGTDAGAVYVFSLDGNLTQTLHNPLPGVGDNFGWSVAAAQDRVLVGAPNSDVGAQDAGAAFLFEASTGIFLKSFQKSTRSVGDYFGWSVGAIGDNILVGAIGDDAGALNAGAVYLFDAGTGSMLRDFKNPDPGDTDQFGLSLACLDGKVIVGAPYDDTGAQDSGAAYLIATATGELVHVFANPTPALSDYFGWSVSFIGSDVIVGSPFDDAGGADAGVAYLFTQIATVQGGTGGGAAGRAL